MAQNINQIFIANPATSMVSTDLLYLGRSPYAAADDFAITWANIVASIIAEGAGGSNNEVQFNNAGALDGLATANNATLITSAAGVPSISSTLPSAVQNNITELGIINENTFFSANGTGNRWILLDSPAGGALAMQAGAGTAAGGGAITCYTASHATRPGWIASAISSGSGGKFAVLSGGPAGTEQFTVDETGNAVANGSLTAGASSTILNNQNAGTELSITNSTNGTAALAGVTFSNNTSSSNFRLYSTGYTGVSGWANRWVMSQSSSIANGILIRSPAGGIQLTADGSTNAANLLVNASGDTVLSGSLSAAGGLVSGDSGSSAGININYSNSVNGSNYTVTKLVAAAAKATVLLVTVPAGEYFIGIECFVVNSRALFSDVGTSLLEKQYFSIGRNGSGTDVVVDGSMGSGFIATSTTAGGSLSATSGAMTIERNAAEANTAPQVVKITINPQVTASGTGTAVIKSDLIIIGSLTGFSIA